jgi:toxin ParE1/3/4
LARERRLTPAAVADLQDIWDYIATDSSTAADAFIQDLYESCDLLAKAPLIGRVRDDLEPGLRCFPHRTYLVFYKLTPTQVVIIRVLHGSRNYNNNF